MLGASSRIERVAPWACGLVFAIPILVARYPPMADLPAHEAVVGLLRHWGDPRFVPPNVYELNLGQPNQLLYFLILPLAHVLSVGAATKTIVAATLLLLPVAAARFADHLGVTRWTALLVAPVGLGWMFFWGLLANLMGLVAYLFALPALDRFVDRPSARGFGRTAAWIVLLHFMHGFVALATAVTVLVLTACASRGWRDGALGLAPGGLAIAIAAVSRRLEPHVLPPTHGETGIVLAPFVERLRGLPGALFAGDAWASGGVFVVAAVPLLLFGIERRRSTSEDARDPAESDAHRLRFELLAGTFVVLYFVAPTAIGWATQIHQRFLPLAWSVAAVAVARRGVHGGWRLPRIAACLAPLAPLLVALPELALSDRAFTDLDALAARIEPGSAVVLLELGPNVDPLFSPVTSGGHIVARVGGRSLFDYTRSPLSPVVRRPGEEWAEVFERLDGHTYRFIPARDLRLFRYAVLHTSDAGLGDLVRIAMQPEATLVAREGELTLLESTLPRIPIDGHEDQIAISGATLYERAIAAAKRLAPADSSRDRPPATAP